MSRPRRADDSFRRHATDIETVAAHEIALDQRHFGAESGRARSAHETGRPRANHH
jgi:hypothetical protein